MIPGWSHVDLPGTVDAGFGIVHDFLGVGNPTGRPADGEHNREHLEGNAQSPHDDTAIKIDIGIELVLDEIGVVQRGIFQPLGDVEQGIINVQRRQQFVTGVADDSGTRIVISVNSMAKTHQTLAAGFVLGRGNESGTVVAGVVDFLEMHFCNRDETTGQHIAPTDTGRVEPRERNGCLRPLGLWSATALVVASMVGTGVFTTSGFLLSDLQSPANVLFAWAGGGVLACLGALNYGALARHIPESGGEYLFLSRTLHPAAGYVAGWISFLVGFSAPVAFAAYAFGEYSKPWWPNCDSKLSGTGLLLILSLIHGAHVRRGAWVQNLAVLLKLGLLIGFAALALVRLRVSVPTSFSHVPISTWAVSLMWVSFSYSGWNAAVYIAGEVSEPERNLPRAMLFGTLLVTVLYLVVNAIFVYAAPAQELAGKPDVGRIAALSLGGPGWAKVVTSLVALVLVSSVSAQVMAGPRVYAKMAADGYLPRWLIMRDRPPRGAIALQAAVALAMLWSASFEWFLTYIGFTLGLSTAVTVLGLVKLRIREGPGFKVVGWPWVPLLFLLGAGTTTLLSVIGKPTATLTGIGTVALSWVAWKLQRNWANSRFIERGGLWVLSQSMLMIALIVLAVMFHSEKVVLALRLAGTLLITIGAFFGVAGVAALKDNRTAFPKPRNHSRLIQHGIYAYVRHPLYTSVIMVSAGWASVWASSIAVVLALAMVPFFYAKARVEENWLREKFPDYRAYERRVCRFVPWLF